jgi:DNA-binding transcriptional MerR regulator
MPVNSTRKDKPVGSSLSIGFVARQTGCTVPTIRYYEELGLLPAVARSDSGHRNYGADAVRRLAFIRRCRDFGFSIEQVRKFIGLLDQPDRPCVEARDIASKQLVKVRDKLAELRALEASLSAFVASCNAACAGGAAVGCTILEDITHATGQTGGPKLAACCGSLKEPIQ